MGGCGSLKHLHEFGALWVTEVLVTQNEGNQVLMPLVGHSDHFAS